MELEEELRSTVPERDNNQQRESLSDSESASGEDLIQSDELKRKGREAKEALRPELPAGDPSDAPQP